LKEAKEELFNLRFQAATGQLDNHSRLRIGKREIARLYTVLREHELGIMPLSGESAEETKEAAEWVRTRPRHATTVRAVRATSSATRWKRPSLSRSRTG